MESFSILLARAIAVYAVKGFSDERELNQTLRELKEAANKWLPSETDLEVQMGHVLGTIFKRAVTNHGIIKQFPQISKFTIDRIAPVLRTELDRRILASASLIKINREQAIEKTLQRFSGWATSIPIGGSRAVDKIEIKASIGKSLQQARYEVRRLNIDQGHKMLSNIAAVVAIQTKAIAARWRHTHMANYDGRKEHIERDGKIYALRGNWAIEQGLMNKCDGYSDEIDQPSEFVYCFPPDSKIPFANGIEKAFRHWYAGELTTLVMASGKTLRGTPNHPILTANGWVALGVLKKGDYVIESCDELIGSAKKYQNHGITTIADIFSSFQKNGIIQSRNGSTADFHGDGSDSNVDTVFSADGLTLSINAFCPKVVDNFPLPKTDDKLLSAGAFKKFCMRCFAASSSLMRGIYTGLSSGFWHLSHANYIGNGLTSYGNTSILQSSNDNGTRKFQSVTNGKQALARLICFNNWLHVNVKDKFRRLNPFANINSKSIDSAKEALSFPADNLCNLLDGLPFTAKPVEIVNVERSSYSGHVYNLQTKDGWYVTDGIITHNCRCKWIYINHLNQLPGDFLTQKGRDTLKEIRSNP